jgi:NAD(P) transhydrogenase
MAQHFDLIVIGSGPAGRRAAVRAAKLKKSALVVERGRRDRVATPVPGTVPHSDEHLLRLSLADVGRGWSHSGRL